MKRIFLYLSMMLAIVTGFTSCNDDFDTPPMVVPTASREANTTIADFKTKYWRDVNNYIDTVKEDVVIKGRVVSSDASGNIYKSLYIADETGGLTISINGNSLYNTYRIGQEVVIPLKDRFVGKYNGQLQLGYPQYYEQGSVWEATFLPLAMWQEMAQLNGLPDVSKIDTIPLNIADLGTDAESLRRWQGQLVRVSGVKFQDADGVATFANADATTNRAIVDEKGNTLITRNSNYATFRAAMLPLGTGDVVGVLSYYNTSRTGIAGGTWQLYLRNTDDCIGFSTSTKGLLTDPYTIDEVIAIQGSGKAGWMTGYIVGAVAPEVTEVKSNADVEWTAPTTLDNTLVIAGSPNVRDIAQCVVVPLPQRTPFRDEASLKKYPDLLGSQIFVKGTFAPYMGANGLTGNSGSRDEYRLTVATGGVTSLMEAFEGGLPSTWSNIKASGDKAWFTTKFGENTYASMTGYKGNKPPFDSWLITPAIDLKNAPNKTLSFRTQVNGYGSTTSKFEVYVMSINDPARATLHKLNVKLATPVASGYSEWQQSGTVDLSAYADGTYFIGFRYYAEKDANYATWCLDDVEVGGAPSPAANPNRADLETMNGGKPTGSYGTFTSTKGWQAENCSLLQGGETDANPVFKFIGTITGSKDWAMAANLNGNTKKVGTLTSPVIAGGIGTLTLNSGFAYTEAKGYRYRVDVYRSGQLIKSYQVDRPQAARYEAHEDVFEMNFDGDIQLVFVNESPSQSTSNKDRVALWNISWSKPGAAAKRHHRR